MICVICLVNLRGSRIVTPCKHEYHLQCLKKITSPYCPLCKRNIKSLLIRMGITKREIEKRLKQDRDRIENDE